MASDSPVQDVAPVTALPLEYGNETLDPFLPVIRKIALVLLAAGVLRVVSSILQLIPMGWGLGPNRIYSWMTMISVITAAFEAVAGGKTIRQTTRFNWLWAWVWIEMIGTSVGHLLVVWESFAMNPHLSTYGLVSNGLYMLLWVPLGWVLPICVMIVLIYRRRFLGGDALR